jgi:hypothetical protein
MEFLYAVTSKNVCFPENTQPLAGSAVFCTFSLQRPCHGVQVKKHIRGKRELNVAAKLWNAACK